MEAEESVNLQTMATIDLATCQIDVDYIAKRTRTHTQPLCMYRVAPKPDDKLSPCELMPQ